jgi:uncharacterized protein YodC (DUF2158 family)
VIFHKHASDVKALCGALCRAGLLCVFSHRRFIRALNLTLNLTGCLILENAVVDRESALMLAPAVAISVRRFCSPLFVRLRVVQSSFDNEVKHALSLSIQSGNGGEPAILVLKGNAMALKPGDNVRLKSGGPLMTIQKIGDEFANCTWFDENDEVQTQSFRPEVLESGKEGD